MRATKGLPVKVKAVPGEDEDDPVVYKEIITDTSLACVVSRRLPRGRFDCSYAFTCFDKDTGRELDKDRDIDVAFSFGGDASLRSKVRFSPNEMKALRMFGQKPSESERTNVPIMMTDTKRSLLSGIKILGFKPITELRFYENVKHSYFIYPSDDVSAPTRSRRSQTLT